MDRHIICAVSELPPGQRKIVKVKGRSIGVFNIDGDFYALRNTCPHQGAPLCLGSLNGTTSPSKPGEYIWSREGEILRCPWHGWEFDVRNGRSIHNPHKTLVRSYEVSVEREEPRVETFQVSVDNNLVVLHL
ncbi:Rieske (2Fe-2S) protein [Actinopolymorpha sp. B11F2]|uniref:Rieske (2Fe-2S) protein n=1 Tax=Actinopolymorpha sp. B11F2 TaxID=3160862 RepID=UPI0032E4B10D